MGWVTICTKGRYNADHVFKKGCVYKFDNGGNSKYQDGMSLNFDTLQDLQDFWHEFKFKKIKTNDRW